MASRGPSSLYYGISKNPEWQGICDIEFHIEVKGKLSKFHASSSKFYEIGMPSEGVLY